LPPEVTFGGSVIFSEPGAFVISDPTLVYGHTNPPGGDPPDDEPFFVPSCARNLSLGDDLIGCCEWGPILHVRQTAFGTCRYYEYVCTRGPDFGCDARQPSPRPLNIRDCCRGANPGPCSRERDICPSPPPPAVCRASTPAPTPNPKP
jgi:hypothetical protein